MWVASVKKDVASINESIRIIERSTKDRNEKRDQIQLLKNKQDRMARSLVPH